MVFAGVEDDQVEQAMKLIDESCHSRTENVPVEMLGGIDTNWLPTEVPTAGQRSSYCRSTRSAGSSALRPVPARLAHERHVLFVDRPQAHAQRRRLLRGDLAHVVGLLGRRHRPPADRVIGPPDHQPRQVVAVHLAPRRAEQLV